MGSRPARDAHHAAPAVVASSARGDAWRAAAIAAIVALGLALRLLHIRLGLPDFIEEAIPFRRAFAMWGWDTGRLDLNPHLFHYSSLTFYLHFLVQWVHHAAGHALGWFATPTDYYVSFQLDPTPMVVLGRLLGVLADGATIAGVAWIGERLRRGAGLVAATLVACSPMMLLTSRAIFSDTIMTAFAVWAIERLVAYHERGGRARLAAAAVLIGLAAGAKYPAALLVLPMAWVVWRRHGLGGWSVAAFATAGAFATFLATSPYIVLDFATFRQDFAFLGTLSGQGHLGSLERVGFPFYALGLASDLGWPCALLAIASLALAIARARTDGAWAAIAIALLVIAIPISVAHVQAQRYLVPVIPFVALLASLAVFEIARWTPAGARMPATVVLLVALVAPSAIGGLRAGRTGADDTQVEARRWCERHLGADDLLLQELHGIELPTQANTLAIQGTRTFRSARPELQRRFLARRVFRVVALPLVVSGRATAGVSPDGRDPVVLSIFPHAVDLNQMFYDPRLLQGVDYVLTSSAVRDRFQADSLRFAAQHRFYRTLDEAATVAAEFRPHGDVIGPDLRVYRLDRAAWDALRARDGDLDPLWWAEVVPPGYRNEADRILTPGQPSSGATVAPDGSLSRWVRTLRPLFNDRLAGFAHQMALQLTELGRHETGMAFSAATLAMAPDDIPACLLFVSSAGELERWADARAAAEGTLEAATATRRFANDDVDFLRVTYADLLRRTGEPERARQILEEVARTSAPGSENAERAQRALAALGG